MQGLLVVAVVGVLFVLWKYKGKLPPLPAVTYTIGEFDNPRMVASVYAKDGSRWPELGLANPDVLGKATAAGKLTRGLTWEAFERTAGEDMTGWTLLIPDSWDAGEPGESLPTLDASDWIPEEI